MQLFAPMAHSKGNVKLVSEVDVAYQVIGLKTPWQPGVPASVVSKSRTNQFDIP